MQTVAQRKKFDRLAMTSAGGLVFGRAPSPVTCGHGLIIGNGEVYPEINFTLPTMSIEESTWRSIDSQYNQIGGMIVRSAQRLHLPGLVVEFELLPPMTEHPEWGAEITRILAGSLHRAHETYGLRSALRVTPTDIRDAVRPPLLRSGKEWDAMRASFEQCADSGADIISIESVGGKEVNDRAMIYGDVAGIIFALGVLAPRDMKFLWDEIVRTCSGRRVVPGGDSACGFANTAMQLASQAMLPEVMATFIRAASAVRSLVAVECGAVGPSKDCAYEGPVLKAIAGIPISMEGKSASCAHFSPVGNVAAAMCDLWSNESVQNIRLLSGSAPEAYLELLAYDCRLFNQALAGRQEAIYQKMLVESDVHLSPQALLLSPASTLRLAGAIAGSDTHYHQTIAAAREAMTIVNEALREKSLSLNDHERDWIPRLGRGLDQLPDREEALIDEMVDSYGALFRKKSYGL